MSEKFSLRWNDFHSNISKSFGLFRTEEYLYDVTLVSADHSKIPAHKLVLSASSEFFKDIFKHSQHSHPLLCLDGISSEELQNILEYIYNGEVEIQQKNLDRFMAFAHKLKLGGLIENNIEERDFNDTWNWEDSDLDRKEINKSKNLTENLLIKPEPETHERSISVDAKDMEFQDIIDLINKYLEEVFDGSYKCKLCGKLSTKTLAKSLQKENMSRHIETHFDGLTFTCEICQKTAKTRNALAKHKSRFHK